MPSDFTTCAPELEAFLQENLPETWKVTDAAKAPAKATGVVLTYELTGFSTRAGNTPLPPSVLGADFSLTLSSPEVDVTKALARVMGALPKLIRVLDTSPDISWDTADRLMTAAGETYFRIPITLLTLTPEEE